MICEYNVCFSVAQQFAKPICVIMSATASYSTWHWADIYTSADPRWWQ